MGLNNQSVAKMNGEGFPPQCISDFLLKFIQPPLSPENIFRGWQNNMTLPASNNDYVVFTVLYEERKGSNVYDYKANGGGSGTMYIQKYTLCHVQLDFCSETDAGMKRANMVETLAGSYEGVEFFKPYGLSCLYADDPKNVEYVDGEDRYIKRSITTLHLSYVSSVPVETPYFDKVNIKRIENVDITHPNK